jgi:hypothetical protein
MELLNTIFPVIIYVLGSILLIVLIVLGIKLIMTLTRIEKVVEDVDNKVKKLNNFFNLIDFTTDKLSFLSNKLVDKMANFIMNMFKKKKVKKEEKGGEDDDE